MPTATQLEAAAASGGAARDAIMSDGERTDRPLEDVGVAPTADASDDTDDADTDGSGSDDAADGEQRHAGGGGGGGGGKKKKKKKHMPQYGDVDYWEARYASSPEAFDWYQGWLGLRPLLLAYLPPDAPILQVGVGTSRLQEGMALCGGYKCVVNVDYSCTAIESMRLLHADVPQLTYLQADARNMPEFEDGCFAGVLDKGTLDAILCGADTVHNAAAMLYECKRVLAPGGAFMLVTYGDPSTRLGYLEVFDWHSIQVYVVTKTQATADEIEQVLAATSGLEVCGEGVASALLLEDATMTSLDGCGAAKSSGEGGGSAGSSSGDAENNGGSSGASGQGGSDAASSSEGSPDLADDARARNENADNNGGASDADGKADCEPRRSCGGGGGSAATAAAAAAAVLQGRQSCDDNDEDEGPLFPPVIKGPYSPSNDQVMLRLGELEGVHFVYVCTKPAASAAAVAALAGGD